MAAADPVPPPEEVALLELPPAKEPPGDPKTKELPGVPKTMEPLGVPMTKEPPGDPKAEEPLGDPKTKELPGVPITKEPPGVPKTKEPLGVPMTKEPPGDAAATLPWEQRAEAPARRRGPDGARGEAEEAPGPPARLAVPIDPRCVERRPPAPRPHGVPGLRAEEPTGYREPPLCKEAPRHREAPWHKEAPRRQEAPRHRAVPLSKEALLFAEAPPRGAPSCCSAAAGGPSERLRAAAAALGALVLCPCLVYGAYVFLPFDAPPLPAAGARLLYALRCAAFATVPVVLGILVHGLSCLCSAEPEPRGELRREVALHRGFVAQSVQLFVLYFLNVAVLATYVPQEALKLVPLLTGLFAISRLLSWLLSAFGRSFRAFGFSLTLVPLVAMLLYNLYGMFVLEPENLLALPGAQAAPGGSRLRLWG